VRPKSQKFTCPKCGHPLLTVDESCAPCRAARTARSAIWYEQNATEASTRRAIAGRLKRRFRPEEIDAITQCLVAEQRGACACCGILDFPLTIEWALDEVNDHNEPMLRGAICRRCKIAVNRYIRPSKYVLVPKVLERVETYVRRRWQDPRVVLKRLGYVQARMDVVENRVAETDDLVAWLDSIST
jgi:hypothetical protein